MSNDISRLREISGFIGACLVDCDTGLMLASVGGKGIDLEAAAASSTEVMKAKLAAIETLELDDAIDEILMTLGKQFHLIRPLTSMPTVFVYLILNRSDANLGMARMQFKTLEAGLTL